MLHLTHVKICFDVPKGFNHVHCIEIFCDSRYDLIQFVKLLQRNVSLLVALLILEKKYAEIGNLWFMPQINILVDGLTGWMLIDSSLISCRVLYYWFRWCFEYSVFEWGEMVMSDRYFLIDDYVALIGLVVWYV